MKLCNIFPSLNISLDNLQTNNIIFLKNLKKSFMNKNFIYIYLLFIPNIIIVYLYNGKSINLNNIDLNNKIIKNICIWNLLHSIVFLILCIILQPETIYDYINIIIVMIVWFLFEYFIYKLNEKLNLIKINNKIINNKHAIYNNPYIPRYDDFIFNIIGVFIYIYIYEKINFINIIILIIILIFSFPIELFLPKHNYKIIRNLLNENEINIILNCFDKNEIKNSYHEKQNIILNKLKKKIKTNYLSIHHARYSHGNKNFDAQSFHRDIKPNFLNNFSSEKYPNIYTIIIPFDKLEHRQGKDKLILQPGDCLIFNSFNLHKGLMKFESKNKRRILQYFHVFFDKNTKNNFYKSHNYSNHVNSNYIMKNINSYRNFFEFVNLSSLINLNNLKYKYTTLIDDNAYLNTFNNIKYYYNF